MTKNSTGKQIDFREGHKYKSLAHYMAGEDSRVRRINTSSTDDEIRTNVHKSQDYHAKFIDAIHSNFEKARRWNSSMLKLCCGFFPYPISWWLFKLKGCN